PDVFACVICLRSTLLWGARVSTPSGTPAQPQRGRDAPRLGLDRHAAGAWHATKGAAVGPPPRLGGKGENSPRLCGFGLRLVILAWRLCGAGPPEEVIEQVGHERVEAGLHVVPALLAHEDREELGAADMDGLAHGRRLQLVEHGTQVLDGAGTA